MKVNIKNKFTISYFSCNPKKNLINEKNQTTIQKKKNHQT